MNLSKGAEALAHLLDIFHLRFGSKLDDLSSIWVAEWPPFGKVLLILLIICSLCFMSICYFPFWGSAVAKW